ncbi:MAG: putative bifunctional diguanylate cyclase/phosphodiesterase [Paracoccaceae bacterium]
MDGQARAIEAAGTTVREAYDGLVAAIGTLRHALRPLLRPEGAPVLDEESATALDRLRRRLSETSQEADAVAQRLEHVATARAAIAGGVADAPAAAHVVEALMTGLAETVRDRADDVVATTARLAAMLDATGEAGASAREALARVERAAGEALREAAAALEATIEGAPAPESLAGADLAWLEALYTMDAERALHAGAIGRTSVAVEAPGASAETPPPSGPSARERLSTFLESTARPERLVGVLAGGFLTTAAGLSLAWPGHATALMPAAAGNLALAKLAYDRVRRRLDVEGEAHRRLAFEDPLTATLNRRGMIERMGATLAPAQGAAQALAVLHVDLDHFKAVNDTLGHEAGDHVLSVAAERMRAAVGEAGVVCRAGGDEFTVLLPGEAAGRAEEIAGAIVASLAEIIDWQGNPCAIGGSIGIAYGGGAEGPRHPERLLADADLATYTAKAEGRGRYAVFDAALRAEMEAEARLVAALKRAIAEDRVEVWFQPVMDLASGRVASLEALARWRDAELGGGDLGEVDPERFLDVAERHNLLDRLSRCVLARTVASIADWRARGLEPPRVSLNLARAELRVSGLAERLAAAVAEAGLSPEDVAVETTEAAAGGRGGEIARALLGDLRDRGFGVVVDRFGRDQVSLAAITAMRPTAVKLDRALVGDLGASAEGLTLLKGLVTLARSLSLEVVAAGVETRAQLAILEGVGCDAMQGFAVARPMSADSLAEWLTFQDAPAARAG